MEPPLASGTILQNRYHLISVLGQGGFGRTYLAEDQGRFDELCALKELIPPETEAYGLDKSKELFQREAETLYKIKHPQVPEFRANFEQDGRLFLVQDYVEGKTYRDLLNERKAQTVIQSSDPNTPSSAVNSSGVFSETEIRHLLQQLLPVLDHIHTKGIIHRDITPDNLIRRNTDRMPVLIDFGVVKELATRFQSPNPSAPITTVGKIGYAPSEQIQTGRAYPSSDLYSLAATAVVLLTGEEPQALLDNVDHNQIWHWRHRVSVSDDFAQILDRMLSQRPGDRYQSAREVIQSLESPAAGPQQPIPIPLPSQQPDSNLSQVATMAVGRRPEPESSSPRSPGRGGPMIPEPSSNSIWDNPWAVAGIGTVLALTAGLGTYAMVSSFNKQEPQATVTPPVTVTETPEPTASETLTPTPTPIPIPIPTPTPIPKPTQTPTTSTQSLSLPPGQTVSKSGNLKANSTVNYVIPGQQGQRLSASLSGEGVLLTVLGPNGNPVNNRANRVTRWQGKLPATGNYTIQLSPVKGLQSSNYKLALSLTPSPSPSPSPSASASVSPSPSPSASPSPSPSASVSPSPSPSVSPKSTYETEPIRLSDGQSRLQLVGQTSPQQIKRYLVNLQEKQELVLDVPNTSDVSLEIIAPNGQQVQSGVKSWRGRVPSTGEYKIDVIAPKKQTNFRLIINVGAK